jgi:hypothetical protein
LISSSRFFHQSFIDEDLVPPLLLLMVVYQYKGVVVLEFENEIGASCLYVMESITSWRSTGGWR